MVIGEEDHRYTHDCLISWNRPEHSREGGGSVMLCIHKSSYRQGECVVIHGKASKRTGRFRELEGVVRTVVAVFNNISFYLSFYLTFTAAAYNFFTLEREIQHNN